MWRIGRILATYIRTDRVMEGQKSQKQTRLIPITVVIASLIRKIIHGSLYLRGHTIQGVAGKVMIGSSIYGLL